MNSQPLLPDNDLLIQKILKVTFESKFNFYLPKFFEDCETHYFRDRQVNEIGNSIFIQIDFTGLIHMMLIVNDDHNNSFGLNKQIFNADENQILYQLAIFLLDIVSIKN